MFKIRSKKSLLTLGVLIILSCEVFAQGRNWKTFSPDNGNWSILSPCVMNPDAEAREPSSTKGSYSCSASNDLFSVVYRDNKKWKMTFAKPFVKFHKSVPRL